MGIIERIRAIIKHEAIPELEFAKRVGLTKSSVNRYLNGTTKMPYELIEKILETYPELSAEWLLRGEGEMEKVYTFLDEGVEGAYGGSVRNPSGVSPDEFEQGLEELRRRVADLERQNTSTAEAV